MEYHTQQPALQPRQTNSCSKCWGEHRGIYVSLPVRLKELNGNITLVCYVGRCCECGHITHYGLHPGIYKLDGKRADTGIMHWPEIKRNNIDPTKFVDGVLGTVKGPVYLNAKHLQAETRERPAFYEPDSKAYAETEMF